MIKPYKQVTTVLWGYVGSKDWKETDYKSLELNFPEPETNRHRYEYLGESFTDLEDYSWIVHSQLRVEAGSG